MTPINTHSLGKTFLKKKLPTYIKLASSVSLVVGAMGIASNSYAQDGAGSIEEIIVTGQRASIQSAQDVKRNANVVVDSIVAEDIGKLPDRSVTEALQRVPGVTVGRYSGNDPEHPAAEGSGVAVRGLTQVRAELNGRDIFSASGGRGLSFEDVPAELMYAVDTYKTPTADKIEGGLGGTVNLRTRMPFDSDGQVTSFTVKGNYGDQREEGNAEYSALYGNRWDTGLGEFGFLINLSTSEVANRSDQIYTRPYLPREIEGEEKWVSKGVDWRRNDHVNERNGGYLALQWAPNDDTEVSFTAFQSQHDSRWDENAFFISGYTGDQALVPVAGANDWVYSSNGALTSGTATVADPAAWGVDFGTSTRYAQNETKTTDYSAGVKWSPDENWKFSVDLQRVESESTLDDYTLGLIVMPRQVSLSGLGSQTPSIAIDQAFMSDYSNYTLGQEMAHLEDNYAESNAFQFDAEYSFDDSIIKSVKSGVRYSEKSSDVHTTPYDWNTRYATWFGFDNGNALPRVTGEQKDAFLELYSFKNFQRGDVNVPGAAYLYSASAVANYRATTDAVNADCDGWYCDGAVYPAWDSDLDLNKADNINTQEETSFAAYFMANYAFEDLAMPVDGNVGVRVVSTDNVAHGFLTYSSFEMKDGTKPYYHDPENFDAKNSYTHVLPSFNIRIQATDDLFIRAAASKTVWAPNFSQLQARMQLSADKKEGITEEPAGPQDMNFSLSQDSNPYLEPMEATQFDLSAEWYFDDNGGMAHVSVFNKNIDGYFRNGRGTFERYDVTYSASWLENQGSGEIWGAELGVSKFFDSLPAPFDGLGVQANYTYIDSSSKVPADVVPLDTDQSTYGELPLEQLSKNSFNIIGMYEKDGFSARLAYSWRSKYLISSDANGFRKNDGTENENWFLPVYNDDYGQLDASIGYTFLDNYTIAAEVSNLTKEKTVGIIDQNKSGDHVAYVYTQDVRYGVSLRVNF
jgi:iron complex outermembrane receptor protein